MMVVGRRGVRSGITLTEILIGIMIMGIGLVSVATLFPLGLLRLREAQRQSRSALLYESAAADMSARALVNAQSFVMADLFNKYYGLSWWYPCMVTPQTPEGSFNPLLQDAASYGGDVYTSAAATDLAGLDVTNANFSLIPVLYSQSRGNPGLPFAYDPLWRAQAYAPGNDVSDPTRRGIYLHDTADDGSTVPEARFGSGLGFVRNDPSGGLPSAHGLQRLTNFNGRKYNAIDSAGDPYKAFVQQNSSAVLSIFVSPEDIVWNEPNNPLNVSPVLPDMSLTGATVNDWRYSWMFTGRLASQTSGSTFEGDLVVFENRPFGLERVVGPIDGSSYYRPEGETVVEAVYGYSASVAVAGGGSVGYGAAADRTVLLRWPDSMADPIVKRGDWICDVTYERRQPIAYNGTTGRFAGYFNPLNGGKFDNLPAQRAFWYQVVKVSPAVSESVGFAGDPDGISFRRMVVQVGSSLRARTPLDSSDGSPHTVNAALIAPDVVNVIPQTIVIH